MKTIAIDLDDVLSNLSQRWISAYNMIYDDDLRHDQVTDWAIEKFVKPECGNDIFKLLTPNLFERAVPLPDAQRVTKWLCREYNLKIVTAYHYTVCEAKAKWIDLHFPHIGSKNIIFCNDKSLIRADCLIDDGAHNIRGFQGKYKILFDYAHNRNVPANEYSARVKNWNEIEELFQLRQRLKLD